MRSAALGRLVVATALSLALAACSSSSEEDDAALPEASPSPTGATAGETVWLCRPGLSPNPCEGGLDATVVTANGKASVERFKPAADPKVDCFYVYPTVSRAQTVNAPKEAEPQVVAVARAQAARLASQCRLFAPVYRQLTVTALLGGKFFDPDARAIADADVRGAFDDYLDNHNDGRGVVLIGHSQGAMALTRLISSAVDNDEDKRKKIVGAYLIGGTTTTATGKDRGGDFANLSQCKRQDETGCVVAYNSFTEAPPIDALFGRSSGDRSSICIQPAKPQGGKAPLQPYLPTAALTPGGTATPGTEKYKTGFVRYSEWATGQCRSAKGMTWLDVDFPGAGSQRPQVKEPLGPSWGLHLVDVNITLGDITTMIGKQAAAWKG